MCYAYPGPRCSSHALATLQTKRDAFIKASSEHIAIRREIEDLLDRDEPIPAELDQRYGDAMMRVTAAKQEKDQAQAEYDATPAGQKKLEVAMETLCSYDPDEWDIEDSERLEHFMDRLEAGRALRAQRMQALKKAQGHVDLEEEDLPKPRSYSDSYFDIEAARKPMPVFVYGSLMEGLHNNRTLGPTRSSEEGQVQGVALFANGNHFPYAVKVDGTEDMSAKGELVEVDDERFAVTLFRMDRLEGYGGPDGDNHYNRVLTTVKTADGRETQAWMYVADPSVAYGVINRMPLIKSGSWREHLSKDDTPWFNNPKYRTSSTSDAEEREVSEPSSKDLGADPPWDD